MNSVGSAIALSIGLFAGLLVCLEIGYRIGDWSSKDHAELTHEGLGTIEAAVFSLLGLLLGFSFAAGTARVDTQRQLIIQEANAVGSAYLRLDLLPPAEQPEMRHLFQEYLDTRLRAYAMLPNMAVAEQELAIAAPMQQQLWSHAVAASSLDPTQNASRLLLPALNEMIAVTTARTIALHYRLSPLILALLVLAALLSSLLAGYGMAKRRRRSWLHMILFAGVISLTVYAVLDMDDARVGLIRLDAADKALNQMRDTMKPPTH